MPNHIHCWRSITYWGLRNRDSEKHDVTCQEQIQCLSLSRRKMSTSALHFRGQGKWTVLCQKGSILIMPQNSQSYMTVLIAWVRDGGCRSKSIIGNSLSDTLLGFVHCIVCKYLYLERKKKKPLWTLRSPWNMWVKGHHCPLFTFELNLKIN